MYGLIRPKKELRSSPQDPLSLSRFHSLSLSVYFSKRKRKFCVFQMITWKSFVLNWGCFMLTPYKFCLEWASVRHSAVWRSHLSIKYFFFGQKSIIVTWYLWVLFDFLCVFAFLFFCSMKEKAISFRCLKCQSAVFTQMSAFCRSWIKVDFLICCTSSHALAFTFCCLLENSWWKVNAFVLFNA